MNAPALWATLALAAVGWGTRYQYFECEPVRVESVASASGSIREAAYRCPVFDRWGQDIENRLVAGNSPIIFEIPDEPPSDTVSASEVVSRSQPQGVQSLQLDSASRTR